MILEEQKLNSRALHIITSAHAVQLKYGSLDRRATYQKFFA